MPNPRPTLAALALVALLAPTAPAALAQTAEDDDPHATGLEFEPDEVYLSHPATSLYRAFLPASVDLSHYMPPVGSQGHQSSCVAWATSYGLRTYYENRLHGGGSTPFSPAFVYNILKRSTGNCNSGTDIGNALDLMKRIGTVPLSDFPYDASNCTRQPGPDVAAEAGAFRIRSWRRVDYKRLDDIKGQLFHGNPVVVGMRVNNAFDHLRADDIYSAPNADGGGHAMVVVGYDDSRSAFRLFNSWGRRWGDGGLGWVDYDTFRTRVHASSEYGFAMSGIAFSLRIFIS